MEKQITVLLAEDNNFFRESICLLLTETNGIELVAVAKNGEEAIFLAAKYLPDIILMDINMFPVNGFEATRKILKQNHTVKIIGLSMHKEVSYCKNLLRLGAKGYLTKDLPYREIVIAIREVAAGGRYIDKDIEDKL